MELGNRMKRYEEQESGRNFIRGLPVVARIDGRAFHSFTRHFDKPYSHLLMRLMDVTTVALVEQTCASVGYTQSDEISLVWLADQVPFFDGRIMKMTSNLASIATAEFLWALIKFELEVENMLPLPTFDCRVWQMPNQAEVEEYFSWREMDAVKNSISMAAHHYLNQSELLGKNSKERQELLFQQKGINWNDYPDRAKRGGYFARITSSRKFTSEELDSLPDKHQARSNPNLEVMRTSVERVDGFPRFDLRTLEAVSG